MLPANLMLPAKLLSALCLVVGSCLCCGLRAQGEREVLCDEGNCYPGDLRVVFDATGTSEACRSQMAGDTVGIRVELETNLGEIQGWTFAVRHDPALLRLVPDSLTIAGTDAERGAGEGFLSILSLAEGTDGGDPGFVVTFIASFETPVNLAVGSENSLARATYEALGTLPVEGSSLRLVDHALAADGGSPVAIGIASTAEIRVPRALVHGVLFEDGEACQPPVGGTFRRADSNADGVTNLADAVFSLQYLFLGLEEPSCLDAADADDDGAIGLADAVFTLSGLFQGGPLPPAPGSDVCGVDPSADGIACESFPPCA